MSKVICDVCGTAYPETASACPICGSAMATGERTAAGTAPDAEGASYTYVKGGRFSKRNVRRRNRKGVKLPENRVTAAERKSAPAPDDNGNDQEEGVNKGLVAVVIVLLLAIVAVLIYIGVRFLAPSPSISNDPDPTPTTNVDPTPTGEPQDTEAPTDANVPCIDLILSMENVSFTSIGGEYTLGVTLAPENTTETVTFASADETVASVSSEGVIRAIGYGETTVTVTCGGVVRQCKVTCISNFTFEFNTNPKWNDPVTGYADTTVTQGETWKAYKGALSVSADQITWISDDTSVATVVNGIVTAVGPGRTLIHAEFGGKRYTCIFRCKAAETTGGDEYESTPNDTGFSFRWAEFDATSGKWDVTLKVGTSWTAYSNGVDPANVTWTIADTTVCTVENGVVTPLQPGITELQAVYDGVTFTCIVRVNP